MSDQNPICWGLLCSSGMVEVVTDTEQELIDYRATDPDDSEIIIPLYRHPQPTLTDEEREAVEMAIACCEDIAYGSEAEPETAATLRKMLARLA